MGSGSVREIVSCGAGGGGGTGGNSLDKSPNRPSPFAFSPCFGDILIIKGNSRTIGSPGATGKTIQGDSAAVNPAQFGYPNGPTMAPVSDQINGTVVLPDSRGGDYTFGDVRDVIGQRRMPSDAKPGENIRDYWARKYPQTLTMEFPGLPRRNMRQVGIGFVIVPTAIGCPAWTSPPIPPGPAPNPIP